MKENAFSYVLQNEDKILQLCIAKQRENSFKYIPENLNVFQRVQVCNRNMQGKRKQAGIAKCRESKCRQVPQNERNVYISMYRKMKGT